MALPVTLGLLLLAGVALPCKAQSAPCWIAVYDLFPEYRCTISWDEEVCASSTPPGRPYASFPFKAPTNAAGSDASIKNAAKGCCNHPFFTGTDAVPVSNGPALWYTSFANNRKANGYAVCACAKGATCISSCYNGNPYQGSCGCYMPDWETDTCDVQPSTDCRNRGWGVYPQDINGLVACCDRLGRSRVWGLSGPTGACNDDVNCVQPNKGESLWTCTAN